MKFQKLVKLASGGSSDIWLVQDDFFKFYAMKELHPSASAHMKQAFAQEIALLQHLHHKAIPKFHYEDCTSKRFYVMEYVHGVTLSTGLAMEEQPLLSLASQLLDVLLYLQRQGWIYCDLKPENIMVVHEHLYLIDFGSVQKLGTQLTSMYATPGFVSPSFQASGIVSEEAVVYAFQKTMLALSGNYPVIEAIQTRSDTTLSMCCYRMLCTRKRILASHREITLQTLFNELVWFQRISRIKHCLTILFWYLFAFLVGSYLLGCLVVYTL